MVEKAAAASWLEDSGQPLAFDTEYLKERIDQTMGLLVDSRKGIWKAMPSYQRPVLATPPNGKETCESIHYSARIRYECGEKGLFSPFPYRPHNLMKALNQMGSVVADLSELERTYRHWRDSSPGADHKAQP
jgi:hypothetical protein